MNASVRAYATTIHIPYQSYQCRFNAMLTVELQL